MEMTIPPEAQDFIGLDSAPRPTRDDNTRQDADENGQPLWEARVAKLNSPDSSQGIRVAPPEIVRITVAGPRPEIVPGAPIRFSGLVLRTWRAKDGREGVMWAAEKMLPASSNGARAAGPAPAASAGSNTPGRS